MRLSLTLAAICASTALAVSGCATSTSSDAGCIAYGAARSDMPRPLGAGALPSWVAGLDAAMTGACR